MKDVNLTQLAKNLKNTLGRFNMTIFIVVIAGGLIAVVLMLNSTINKSTDGSSYQANNDMTDGFDKKTMEQVEKLQALNQDPSSTKLPSGRINPFVE